MQTWNDVLIKVVEILFYVITALVIPYMAYILKKRTENDNVQLLIDKSSAIVGDCVKLVNQTFVGSLKEEGKFDAAAQAEAFTKCKDQVLKLLSDEAKTAIVKTTGDLSAWIKTQIEAKVYDAKKIA